MGGVQSAFSYTGAWKFPSFAYFDGLLPTGDYSRHMQRLAAIASEILMLKLFISFQTWFHVKIKH